MFYNSIYDFGRYKYVVYFNLWFFVCFNLVCWCIHVLYSCSRWLDKQEVIVESFGKTLINEDVVGVHVVYYSRLVFRCFIMHMLSAWLYQDLISLFSWYNLD